MINLILNMMGVLPATVKIACLGDSITYGGGSGTIPGNCDARSPEWDMSKNYPSRLSHYLGEGYDVQNFGFCGAGVRQGYTGKYIEKFTYADAKAFRPDITIWMLGSNDAGKEGGNLDLENWEDEYMKMLDEFAYSKIYLVTPPKMWGNVPLGHGFIPQLERIALKTKGRVINVVNEDWKKEYVSDGIHLTNEGYDFLAQKIREQLEEDDLQPVVDSSKIPVKMSLCSIAIIVILSLVCAKTLSRLNQVGFVRVEDNTSV